MDALRSDRQFERIYIKSNITGAWEREVRNLCTTKDIPLKKVPSIKLDKLSRNRNHQGIVGITSLISYQKVGDIIPHLFDQGIAPLCILLDNVTDVRNIGAVARSVEVLGIHALILGGKNVGMVNQDSIKASAGAILNINICREKDTIKAISMMHDYGMTTMATTLDAPSVISDKDLTIPVCFVLGSEGDGLDPKTVSLCQHQVRIPQIGTSNSLNISVAAGICMYEASRQRVITGYK